IRNGTLGVEVQTAHNVIGGPLPGMRNVLTASGDCDIVLYPIGSQYNTVQGNYIGTDITGTKVLLRSQQAVCFSDTATYNLIGVAADGITPLPNGEHGVNTSNSVNNVIGGPTAAARNVIANSVHDGIHFNGGGTNTVQGNLIQANGRNGIFIDKGSSANTVL